MKALRIVGIPLGLLLVLASVLLHLFTLVSSLEPPPGWLVNFVLVVFFYGGVHIVVAKLLYWLHGIHGGRAQWNTMRAGWSPWVRSALIALGVYCGLAITVGELELLGPSWRSTGVTAFCILWSSLHTAAIWGGTNVVLGTRAV